MNEVQNFSKEIIIILITEHLNTFK